MFLIVATGEPCSVRIQNRMRSTYSAFDFPLEMMGLSPSVKTRARGMECKACGVGVEERETRLSGARNGESSGDGLAAQYCT